jgi:hypothetical protein
LLVASQAMAVQAGEPGKEEGQGRAGIQQEVWVLTGSARQRRRISDLAKRIGRAA